MDRRLHWPAPERNRAPIFDVLARALPPSGLVLEVASGTGQHAAYFAARLDLVWQTSDPAEENLRSIDAWAQHEGLPNLPASLQLDVTMSRWPLERADAIFDANMVHIAPWEAATGLFRGAGTLLTSGAPLITYGPYRIEGRHTSPSNEEFDQSLRARDSSWGIRDIEALTELADESGLDLEERVAMPANNFTLIWRRR